MPRSPAPFVQRAPCSSAIREQTARSGSDSSGTQLAPRTGVSKTHSNVATGHYKVAGRDRQGEDVVHGLHKARLAQSRAQLEEAELAWRDSRMPEQETLDRADRDKEEGKSPSTQAGEFVREEIHHIREGKHGARSTKQAIAIGLSKARRAGVKLGSPKAGKVSAETRRQAARDSARGRSGRGRTPSPKRSRAVLQALKREGRGAASRKSLASQARASATSRGPRARKAAARKAARSRAR
jgi:hypothetical protein